MIFAICSGGSRSLRALNEVTGQVDAVFDGLEGGDTKVEEIILEARDAGKGFISLDGGGLEWRRLESKEIESAVLD